MGKVFNAAGALAVAFALMLPFGAGQALAQDSRFPVSAYGKVNIPPPQSLTNVEAVLRSNPNFEPLGSYNPNDRLRQLSRPIGRLDILYGEFASFCTAWIISAEYIMTNNHCIPGEGDVVEASLLMGYYSQMDGAGTQRFAVEVQPVETDAALDYSVLRVLGNPAAQWGRVTIVAEDPAPAAALLLIGHPEGRPKMVTRGGCRAASPNPSQGDQILHKCDTLGGSSGSPLFRDRDGAAIGLHHAGTSNPQELEFNFAIRMERIAAVSPVVRDLLQTPPAATPTVPGATTAAAPAAAATTSTSVALDGAILTSGEFRVDTWDSSRIHYPSIWTLSIKNGRVSGSAEWVNENFTDPIEGKIDSETITINRPFSYLFFSFHQVYTGRRVGDVIEGTFSGTGGPGTWKLYVR